MPAGLDGNPDPLVTPVRTAALRSVAAAVVSRQTQGQVLVGIDGASGSGKSTFADELAGALPDHTPVVRASIDSFHRPKAQRYRRGKDSGEGYYRDSHDLVSIVQQLLAPFARGSGLMKTAVFDEPSDKPIDEPATPVPAPGTLIVDGVFLQRPELVDFWDVTVFLVADERRNSAWEDYLIVGLPDDPAQRAVEIHRRVSHARIDRYLRGQHLYEREADPRRYAQFVIDNDDLANPQFMASGRTFR